ncbi:hypothetical protein DL769_011412 [Monosporascus sp. CRB-8-3]|nr:hypothetical protein DL769_011412 [Monosporascus sp. CRB-8-3]
MSHIQSAADPPRHLPRILCLHGGGTNARVFRAQCRALETALSPHFRLVYAEAPFDSVAGPDVLSVYADYGPFKRWLRWLPEHPPLDNREAVAAVDAALAAAKDADDAAGGAGPWVGLLGFSQGAKLAASLLLRQQVREEEKLLGAGSRWRFGVIMAGRNPLVALDLDVFASSLLSGAGEIGLRGPPDLMDVMAGRHVLRLPTVHVHGMNDPGLHLHRELMENYCDPASVRLVEWDGGHRVPFKATDVQPVVDQILEVAKETGVI